MNKFLKPTPLKIFNFIILFLLLLATESSDISFRYRGSSTIPLLKALVMGLELNTDAYIITFLLIIISYLIVCLVFYVLSKEAIEIYKRPPRKKT